jgi:hypothetical protein
MESDSISGLLDRFNAWVRANGIKPSWPALRGWVEANYPDAHDKDRLADEIWATPSEVTNGRLSTHLPR